MAKFSFEKNYQFKKTNLSYSSSIHRGGHTTPNIKPADGTINEKGGGEEWSHIAFWTIIEYFEGREIGGHDEHWHEICFLITVENGNPSNVKTKSCIDRPETLTPPQI